MWLSIAAWCVLLIWLWPRASRQRMLLWVGLAFALHLTPVVGQVIRATSAITTLGTEVPAAFWALQGVNVAVLCMIVATWYFTRRRLVRYRQAQAVLAERRRIASDLHDGVGSRLVALMASYDPRSADARELSMALQACLLELQLTVDSLDDQADTSIGERLGHLRYRLQPAFDRLGITLVWNVQDVVLAPPLSPEAAMQLCRIAQEALSNVLRHSQATRVEVRFGPRERSHGLVLEVLDDGRGLDATAGEPGGKGLRSMRERADALHGELAIMDAAPHGLRIRLVMPGEVLPQSAVAAPAESTL
ncbi:signal transduction histidine kinase [Variovorax boronicumulans]|uniref:Signal transduction histidine kinase n=1 Tax=Variovorax boronicumulans TaxID=436515 RepID=A0AAW8E437_9BURK|nr:ATP-binding protein [Variovorax boronicumulans]MDP9881209.1 signal transduction histidine kinase [Variovorax boronicumulans]MDP9926496.1 signal transduction histidine kinase [Variovorax boronicumulans]